MAPDKRNLLLLSGSRVGDRNVPGGGFLEFAEPWIKEHFKDAIQSGEPIMFVPYAMPHPFNEETYVDLIRNTFKPWGINIISSRDVEENPALINQVKGIFIGGGNTYRLLDELQKTSMLPIIQQKIAEGMPYVGSSAGTVIACPTIATTNDMHSRIPSSLDSLNAIPFQLNCHFMDDFMFDPKHNGETRTTRIAEYQRENPEMPVLGIREGTALRVKDGKYYLLGQKPARFFRYEKDPIELDGEGGKKDISRTILYQKNDIALQKS